MIALDTNILVRYLAQDDPKQAAVATQIIEKTCSQHNPGYVNHIVLCELVWVLESNYDVQHNQIVDIIEQLLQTNQLEIMESQTVWQTLNDYKHSSVDFSDHLLARTNQVRGCDTTLTFDKKAGKLPHFTLAQ